MKNELCTLMRGDCLERMKEIPDASVDMVMCDLPYGTTACAWDSMISFAPLWEQYWRVCRGAVVLTASQPFTTALISSAINTYKHSWIWNKPRPSNPMQAKMQPLRIHEDVVVFCKTRTPYFPQDLKRTEKPRGGTRPSKTALGFGTHAKAEYVQEFYGYPKSIVTFSVDNSKNVHPTQKPVALMDYMIRTYTNAGDVVLDNCMGSGTTGVAALDAGRRFVGIERDEGYFDIAERRIRACEGFKLFYGE